MNYEHEPIKKRKKCLSETKMAASVVVGVWNSDQFQRFNIENVDLDSKVEIFKCQALKIINTPITEIDLSFCSVILDNENTLSSYGVTPGVTIHVLEKPKHQPLVSDQKLTETAIVNSFKTIKLFNEYRSLFQRLTRKEIVDKVIQATPGLEDDPAALAIIQDPELLVYLAHSDTVAKLAKEHPVLLEAAKHIVSYINEAQANVNPNQASTSTGYSYSLEALSDDDDDMDSNSDTNTSQFPITRNSSFNAITAAQLAAAIANATNTQFNTNSAGIPSTPTSTNIITNEMFSNAIQQAFAVGGNSSNVFSPSTPTRGEEESVETSTGRWEAQLQQMHEMGLINDVVNMRALRATNGDVNAAIELVLSLSYEN